MIDLSSPLCPDLLKFSALSLIESYIHNFSENIPFLDACFQLIKTTLLGSSIVAKPLSNRAVLAFLALFRICSASSLLQAQLIDFLMNSAETIANEMGVIDWVKIMLAAIKGASIKKANLSELLIRSLNSWFDHSFGLDPQTDLKTVKTMPIQIEKVLQMMNMVVSLTSTYDQPDLELEQIQSRLDESPRVHREDSTTASTFVTCALQLQRLYFAAHFTVQSDSARRRQLKAAILTRPTGIRLKSTLSRSDIVLWRL